jgi:hypothetical protein
MHANDIPQFQPTLSLTQKMSSLKIALREQIESTKSAKNKIWELVVSRSKEYMEALGLTKDDLEIIEQSIQIPCGINKGFMKVNIGNTRFTLSTNNVRGPHYDPSSRFVHLIQASSEKADMNVTQGYGNCFIHVIPLPFHLKILEMIKNGDIQRCGRCEIACSNTTDMYKCHECSTLVCNNCIIERVSRHLFCSYTCIENYLQKEKEKKAKE